MAKHLWGVSKPVAEPVTGITFPSNNAANSDARFTISGLSRTLHTVAWKVRFVQQAGYYAEVCHTANVSPFPGNGYEYITCLHPCDGTFDGDGQRLVAGGDSGTVHYNEIAGLGAVDRIASPGGSSYLATKGVWLSRMRTARLITVSTTDDTIEHVFYPDLSSPSSYIRQLMPVSSLNSPSAPVLNIGAHPWTVTGSANEETLSGDFRDLGAWSSLMTTADVILELAGTNNTPQTVAGAANVFYRNKNLTPDDISDKSGQGNHGTWANSNHGSLYTA